MCTFLCRQYCPWPQCCMVRDCLCNSGWLATSQNWMKLWWDTQGDPQLQGSSTTIQQHLLLSFAARNRRGYYGRGRQVGTKTSENALRHVAQTIALEGYANPHLSYSSTDTDVPFSCLLKSYKTDDLAPKTQLALHIKAIQCVSDFYCTKQTLATAAVSDLITIALFSLLGTGEYAMKLSRSRNRIVQLRQQDVRFFKRGTVLPHATPLE